MAMETATQNVLRLQNDTKQQVFVSTLKRSSRQSKSHQVEAGSLHKVWGCNAPFK